MPDFLPAVCTRRAHELSMVIVCPCHLLNSDGHELDAD